MRRSELAGLDLETVQPVAPPQRLHDITPDRQPSRLPLPQNVKVLVQHQVGIAPERGSRIAQQNAIASGRGAGAEMQACVEGMLDDAHVLHRLAEDFLQRCEEWSGRSLYPHTHMKRIRVLALLAIVILLVSVVFSPPSSATRWTALLHNTAHAPIFGCVAALVLTVLRNSARWQGMRTSRQYLVAFAAAVILGIATELLQALTGGDPSFADAARDVLGAASFLLVVAAFDRHGTGQQRWSVRRIVWIVVAVVLLAPLALPFKEVVREYSLRDGQFPVLADFSNGGSRFFLGDHTPTSIEPMPAQWAARGEETSLRVHLLNQHNAGLNLEEPVPRWRDYSTLAIDLTNPTAVPLTLVVRVHDIHHNYQYVDRFNQRLLVEPHARRVIRIAISDIERGPKLRKLDLDNIAGVMLFRPEPSGATEMYVSRIWLEGGGANASDAASAR